MADRRTTRRRRFSLPSPPPPDSSYGYETVGPRHVVRSARIPLTSCPVFPLLSARDPEVRSSASPSPVLGGESLVLWMTSGCLPAKPHYSTASAVRKEPSQLETHWHATPFRFLACPHLHRIPKRRRPRRSRFERLPAAPHRSRSIPRPRRVSRVARHLRQDPLEYGVPHPQPSQAHPLDHQFHLQQPKQQSNAEQRRLGQPGGAQGQWPGPEHHHHQGGQRQRRGRPATGDGAELTRPKQARNLAAKDRGGTSDPVSPRPPRMSPRCSRLTLDRSTSS